MSQILTWQASHESLNTRDKDYLNFNEKIHNICLIKRSAIKVGLDYILSKSVDDNHFGIDLNTVSTSDISAELIRRSMARALPICK